MKYPPKTNTDFLTFPICLQTLFESIKMKVHLFDHPLHSMCTCLVCRFSLGISQSQLPHDLLAEVAFCTV